MGRPPFPNPAATKTLQLRRCQGSALRITSREHRNLLRRQQASSCGLRTRRHFHRAVRVTFSRCYNSSHSISSHSRSASASHRVSKMDLRVLLIDIPDRWHMLTVHRRRGRDQESSLRADPARKVRSPHFPHLTSGQTGGMCLIERRHKTDPEEFYQGSHFKYKRGLARKPKKWETEYNEDRPIWRSMG
jgi:hypothetical protein